VVRAAVSVQVVVGWVTQGEEVMEEVGVMEMVALVKVVGGEGWVMEEGIVRRRVVGVAGVMEVRVKEEEVAVVKAVVVAVVMGEVVKGERVVVVEAGQVMVREVEVAVGKEVVAAAVKAVVEAGVKEEVVVMAKVAVVAEVKEVEVEEGLVMVKEEAVVVGKAVVVGVVREEGAVMVKVAAVRVVEAKGGWVAPVRVGEVRVEALGMVALVKGEGQVRVVVVVLGMVVQGMEEVLAKGAWEMVEVKGWVQGRVMVVERVGVEVHTMMLVATVPLR
jgi:hypothetical protein